MEDSVRNDLPLKNFTLNPGSAVKLEPGNEEERWSSEGVQL
ncbi:MAG TPA: hypothetical protein VIH18_08955 [Candidatus Binatia bacterium]|jgi:hypothetical protein